MAFAKGFITNFFVFWPKVLRCFFAENAMFPYISIGVMHAGVSMTESKPYGVTICRAQWFNTDLTRWCRETDGIDVWMLL